VRITDNGSDSFPAWSPDGHTIAFSRDVGGNVDIYTVNVDGRQLQRLTSVSGHDTLPAYTPDGDIIFRSARSGSWGIWKMNGDGSDQVNIIPDACVGSDWAFSKMDVLP
jgi:Tol biopolymer transport system component